MFALYRIGDDRFEVAAEGFDYGEYDLTGGREYGVALDKVKESVGVAVLLRVQSVEVHDLQQRFVVEPGYGQIVDFGAGGVAQVLDVELEFSFWIWYPPRL